MCDQCEGTCLRGLHNPRQSIQQGTLPVTQLSLKETIADIRSLQEASGEVWPSWHASGMWRVFLELLLEPEFTCNGVRWQQPKHFCQNFDLDVHESEHMVTQSDGFDPEAPPSCASCAVNIFLLAHACHWAWF